MPFSLQLYEIKLLNLGIVVLLVVCHTPKTFINVYESYQVIQKPIVYFEEPRNKIKYKSVSPWLLSWQKPTTLHVVVKLLLVPGGILDTES